MNYTSIIRTATVSLSLFVASAFTQACAMEEQDEPVEAQSDAVKKKPTPKPSTTETIKLASESTTRETGITQWRMSVLSDRSGRIVGLGAGGAVLFDFTTKITELGNTAAQISMTAKSNLPSPDGKRHLIRIERGVVTEKHLSPFEHLAWKHLRDDLDGDEAPADACGWATAKLFFVSAATVIGCATAVTGVGLALCLIGAGAFVIEARDTLVACGYVAK